MTEQEQYEKVKLIVSKLNETVTIPSLKRELRTLAEYCGELVTESKVRNVKPTGKPKGNVTETVVTPELKGKSLAAELLADDRIGLNTHMRNQIFNEQQEAMESVAPQVTKQNRSHASMLL